MKKKLALLTAIVFALTLLTGCEGLNIDFSSPQPAQNAPSSDAPSSDAASSGAKEITLNGSSAVCTAGGVAINGSVVTIAAAGEYTVSGTLDNGQLIVNTGEDAMDVTVHLHGVSITNQSDAAIYVAQAKNVYLMLDDGTENTLVSGTESTASAFDGTQNGAAIFSEDDLKISGNGKLDIRGMINNGITGKDDVDIQGGAITISAVNNGIKGSESVTVTGGALAITSGNDGIKSSSALKEGKGYVRIDDGAVSVSCVGDGISAETELTVNGGSISVESTGDPASGSCKAVKAKTGLTVNGGTLCLTSRDHTLHSAAWLTVSGGELELVSHEGKGLAAHGDILLSGGTLNISAFDDGIEGATVVALSGSAVNIDAGGSGIKVGEKGNGFTAGTGSLSVSGGSAVIFSAGVPLNSRGTMAVSGGTVLGLGTAKTLREFDSFSQSYLSCGVSLAAGTDVSIDDVTSFTAGRSGNCLIFTSPALKAGTEYSVSSVSGSVIAAAK